MKKPVNQMFTGFYVDLVVNKWSRRESNPRPNKQLQGFLHV